LAVGIIFGPQVCDFLPDYVRSTFIILGYIGLILMVFEGGLSTNISLLRRNLFLSSAVALSGITFPIVISLVLLSFGYGYSTLQAFGAGAALCSTSLGTTIALLHPELRKTQTGTVLLSAALLDDIAGLVFAAIIPQLPFQGSDPRKRLVWHTIARPILVSLAFGLGTPILAFLFRWLSVNCPSSLRTRMCTKSAQLFLIVSVLSGFVAATKYSGTSELFGSYLAGALLNYVFSCPEHESRGYSPTKTFTMYILPVLQTIFSPVFFASIGSALPIRSLFRVGGSRRVVWRGILYALLMIIAKALVGFWMLIWPHLPSNPWQRGRQVEPRVEHGTQDRNHNMGEALHERNESTTTPLVLEKPVLELAPRHSAQLIGLAMVARGEIALIVAQLAWPLLGGGTSDQESEPFSVVIWAILVTTISGALGVGLFLQITGICKPSL